MRVSPAAPAWPPDATRIREFQTRGGQHILFAWDPKRPVTNSPGALKGQSIDVRGEGGYVIISDRLSAQTAHATA
jgi:hypothetical protein